MASVPEPHLDHLRNEILQWTARFEIGLAPSDILPMSPDAERDGHSPDCSDVPGDNTW